MSAQTPLLIGTGIAAVVWGVGTVAYTGITKQITLKHDGEISVIYDNNGWTQGKIYFDDQDEVTVDMVLQTTDTIPTRGTVLTVAGNAAFICETYTKTWEQKKEAGWQFTAKYHPNIVAP